MSALLAGVGSVGRNESGVDARLRDRLSLLQASRQLLGYSANYHWLYGSRGAGPGHFPCPDTGRLSGVFGGDGPDPPCAASGMSGGKLPRHVALSGQRLLLHGEFEQRIEYRINNHYINNPLDRIVNSHAPPVAEGDTLPLLDLTLGNTRLSLQPEQQQDVLVAAVLAWLVAEEITAEQLDRLDERHWFRRNRWHDVLRWVWHPRCRLARLTTDHNAASEATPFATALLVSAGAQAPAQVTQPRSMTSGCVAEFEQTATQLLLTVMPREETS